jgi:hypothetical protein
VRLQTRLLTALLVSGCVGEDAALEGGPGDSNAGAPAPVVNAGRTSASLPDSIWMHPGSDAAPFCIVFSPTGSARGYGWIAEEGPVRWSFDSVAHELSIQVRRLDSDGLYVIRDHIPRGNAVRVDSARAEFAVPLRLDRPSIFWFNFYLFPANSPPIAARPELAGDCPPLLVRDSLSRRVGQP